MEFHEEAFEGTVEIVAAAMEEAEVELSAEGGELVADFSPQSTSGSEALRPVRKKNPSAPALLRFTGMRRKSIAFA